MTRSTLMRSIGIIMAVAVIGAALTGCVSDAGTALSGLSQGAGDNPPMRYYGGPKSPMWPDR